jgi:hypothetical protein
VSNIVNRNQSASFEAKIFKPDYRNELSLNLKKDKKSAGTVQAGNI